MAPLQEIKIVQPQRHPPNNERPKKYNSVLASSNRSLYNDENIDPKFKIKNPNKKATDRRKIGLYSKNVPCSSEFSPLSLGCSYFGISSNDAKCELHKNSKKNEKQIEILLSNPTIEKGISPESPFQKKTSGIETVLDEFHFDNKNVCSPTLELDMHHESWPKMDVMALMLTQSKDKPSITLEPSPVFSEPSFFGNTPTDISRKTPQPINEDIFNGFDIKISVNKNIHEGSNSTNDCQEKINSVECTKEDKASQIESNKVETVSNKPLKKEVVMLKPSVKKTIISEKVVSSRAIDRSTVTSGLLDQKKDNKDLNDKTLIGSTNKNKTVPKPQIQEKHKAKALLTESLKNKTIEYKLQERKSINDDDIFLRKQVKVKIEQFSNTPNTNFKESSGDIILDNSNNESNSNTEDLKEDIDGNVLCEPYQKNLLICESLPQTEKNKVETVSLKSLKKKVITLKHPIKKSVNNKKTITNREINTIALGSLAQKEGFDSLSPSENKHKKAFIFSPIKKWPKSAEGTTWKTLHKKSTNSLFEKMDQNNSAQNDTDNKYWLETSGIEIKLNGSTSDKSPAKSYVISDLNSRPGANNYKKRNRQPTIPLSSKRKKDVVNSQQKIEESKIPANPVFQPTTSTLRRTPYFDKAMKAKKNLLRQKGSYSTLLKLKKKKISHSVLAPSSNIQSGSEFSHTTTTMSNLKLPSNIYTRMLLSASVYHNQATGLWITIINTNQRSSRKGSDTASNLKAFSFHTEREARESAYANTPPKMLEFDDNPTCFSCKSRFTVFKRASHCRNCGVCVCCSCSNTWNKVMIPETYNIKNERTVKACNTCNNLATAFQNALLQANFDDALTIYNSGNINLRCPFLNVKTGEVMFPIHCAVLGGSLKLFLWLVDVHFCPIKMTRTGNRNNQQVTEELIKTSKKRSVLDIAMTEQRADILQYLVNEKNVSLEGIRDVQTSIAALNAVLKSVPYKKASHNNLYASTSKRTQHHNGPFTNIAAQKNNDNICEESRNVCISKNMDTATKKLARFDICDLYNKDNDKDNESISIINEEDLSDEISVVTTVAETCILCNENFIDCMFTPCGHQLCCHNCSKKIKKCPDCQVNCQVIQIFKP